MTLHGFAQKGFGRVYVTIPTQIEINRLSGLVDRPIQVHSFAAHLHVSLVHAPGTADRADVSFPPLLKLGTVMLHPSQNRRMREVNTAFVHHGHQVAIAQFVAELPTDTDHHDLLVKVPAFEQLLDRYESWHLSMIADSWSSLHESRRRRLEPLRPTKSRPVRCETGNPQETPA